MTSIIRDKSARQVQLAEHRLITGIKLEIVSCDLTQLGVWPTLERQLGSL